MVDARSSACSTPPSSCCERWGIAKVTIDDIATEAGVSRATLYRMFPGGKDVLFEALRVRELEEFFTRLQRPARRRDDLEDLLVRASCCATRELRNDEHLALMLASEPGEALGQLTVDGLPRIIRVATVFLAPLVDELPVPPATAPGWSSCSARLVISYFLAPSEHVDLGDADSARTFIQHLHPSRPSSHHSPGADLSSPMTVHAQRQRDDHRPRRDQRPRGDPGGPNTDVDEVDPHRRRTTPTPSSRGTTSAAAPALSKLYEKAKTSQWNGDDRPRLGDRGRPGEGRAARLAQAATARFQAPQSTSTGTPFEKWGDKEWLAVRHRGAELDAVSQFMHGEQGALLCTAQDRRDRAVDRRQVLRGDAGDGRGPPRRGVRQVPRQKLDGPLPDQRPPRACCSTTSSTTAAGT